ncbi:MAG: GLPGLI family protein [Capnocytophaga sp.]|nr:GLPGLI family protein [Capnocytophaga sp.]
MNRVLPFCCILCSIAVFPQTGKIVYGFTYEGKVDEKHYQKMSNTYLTQAQEMYSLGIEAEKTVNILLFNSKNSYFYTEVPMESEGKNSLNRKKTIFGLEKAVWGDNTSKTIFTEAKMPAGNTLLMEYGADYYSWKVTNESKTVMGYTVYKAVRQHEKNTVTAWYAPSLPYSYGPSKYFGLPGMILEVHFATKTGLFDYTLKAISISFHSKEKISPKPDLPIHPQEEINAVFREMLDKRKEYR